MFGLLPHRCSLRCEDAGTPYRTGDRFGFDTIRLLMASFVRRYHLHFLCFISLLFSLFVYFLLSLLLLLLFCCWQKEASRSDVTCTATRAPLSASGIGSDSGRTITSDNVTSTRRGQHDELTSTSVAAPSPTLTAIATATATSSPISTWTVATHVACLTGPDTWPGCSWGSQRTLLPRVAKRDSAASEAHFCHANVHVACCRPDQTRAAPGRWLSTNWPSCGAQIQQQTGAIHFESFYCVPTATERSQGSSRSTKPTMSLNRLKARW